MIFEGAFSFKLESSGPSPTLDLLKYAIDLGIEYTRTGTNGFMFLISDKEGYEERITELVQAMLKSDLRNLWISLDHSDVELYEKMNPLWRMA